MTFDQIKAAVLKLNKKEQRRVIQELLPAMWPNLVDDESSIQFLRKLVDEESVRKYKEEHLGHI
jgi:hypothetical protein